MQRVAQVLPGKIGLTLELMLLWGIWISIWRELGARRPDAADNNVQARLHILDIYKIMEVLSFEQLRAKERKNQIIFGARKRIY